MIDLTLEIDVSDACVGVAIAMGCRVAPTPPALELRIVTALESASARAADADVKNAVRALLRYGRYKPTGRAKPASEYLLNAAVEQRFPRVNNLVDLGNCISLEALLPVSLIDLDRAGSSDFRLRRGRLDEAYVFNSGGQSIELLDLLLVAVAPDDRPCANPVKDSMATKLHPGSSSVLGVVYAPVPLAPLAASAAAALAEGFRNYAGAAEVGHRLVGA